MRRHLTLSLLLAASLISHSASAQLKDTLFLHDGQILSGEFKKFQYGKIEFDMDNVQIVNVKYNKIRTIRTHQHNYRVETADRRIITGVIKPAENDGIIRIQTKDSVILIPIDQATLITAFDPRWIKNIHGYVSAGYSYTKSSNIGRLNLDASANFNSRKFNSILSGNAAYTTEKKTLSRDRENISTSNFYILTPWWSLGAILSYQRNLELGLLRRYQESFGYRYNVIYRNRFQLRLLSGITINQERNINSESLKPVFEIPLNVNLNLFKFEKPNISITTSQTVFVGLTQKGRVRYDGDTRFSWEMIKDLSLTTSIYHSYDSKPVAAGANNFDFGIVFGLKYTF
jgi:Protein of unknown function, DUF481